MQPLDANGNKFQLPKGEPIFWRISGYVLIMSDNKLLAEIPTWSPLFELPGGGVEEDERIKDGIIRECYEETGYKIKITDNVPFYLGESNFYHRHQKKFYHSIIIVYKASLANKKQNKSIINTRDGDEIQKIFWKKLSAFTKKNTHPIIYPAIYKLRKNLKTK